jgi:hypothetical protein
MQATHSDAPARERSEPGSYASGSLYRWFETDPAAIRYRVDYLDGAQGRQTDVTNRAWRME